MYLKKIERFINYFKNEFNLIESISRSREYKVHKKALYCSLIDALSGVIYPKKGNRARFVDTILTFGEWKYAEHVSVPHIARLLELNPAPEYSKLRKYIFEKFDEWSEGDLVTLDKDVHIGEVGRLWPKGKEHLEAIDGISLDSLKHVRLLYSYRNSLIHEFRPLGTDAEMPEDENPYYLSISDFEKGYSHWNLIYPTPFFQKICLTIFNNIEPYFKENRIDPIEVVRRGRYWLKGLNK